MGTATTSALTKSKGRTAKNADSLAPAGALRKLLRAITAKVEEASLTTGLPLTDSEGGNTSTATAPAKKGTVLVGVESTIENPKSTAVLVTMLGALYAGSPRKYGPR